MRQQAEQSKILAKSYVGIHSAQNSNLDFVRYQPHDLGQAHLFSLLSLSFFVCQRQITVYLFCLLHRLL